MIMKNIAFSKDAINVFIIRYHKVKHCFSQLKSYLSHEERFKANKFLFEHLKENYIISHGILRVLLSKYLYCSPWEIEYIYNKFQKPLCKNNLNLHFNMSHSNGLVCYVFSFNYQVGIDIEFLNNKIEINNLLPLVATSKELSIFNKLNNEDKIYLFYKMWTIKEAFLKTLGFGLLSSVLNIETTLIPKEKFKIIRFHDMKEKEIVNT